MFLKLLWLVKGNVDELNRLRRFTATSNLDR